jgi:AmmeMemoRadiSam system protein B
MTTIQQTFPKLRPLDVHPVMQNGRQGFFLRDPLQLCEETVVVPQPLHLLLPLCDGTREDAGALSASLAVRHGIRIAPSTIDRLLSALDRTCLLENETYVQARARALGEYRAAPFRPAASAGQSYPADAKALRQMLDRYLDQANAVHPPIPAPVSGLPIRGLVSPHIDYARGGPVYAQVWRQAADAARKADLVLILGTDHVEGIHPPGSAGTITLTRQHYATPYGILPTANGPVEALAKTLGEENAFAEELHHRTEHSIELAAVWLHHMRSGEPCDIVPVLCGSFRHCIQGDVFAAEDMGIQAFTETFRRVTAGQKVLVVAAADLAHIGPAFGGHPVDMVGRARLQAADDALIEQINGGDADGFLTEIQRVEDCYHVCGVPPIYLALRLLQADRVHPADSVHPAAQGELVAYDRCPADGQGTSMVSICGIIFR